MSVNDRLDEWKKNFNLRQERRAMLPQWVIWAHMIFMISGLMLSVFGYVWLVQSIHGWFHPGITTSHASSVGQKLMFIPVLTGMLGPCFVIGNFLEWVIVPIRRQWKIHFDGVPGGSLSDAIRVTAWLMLVWLVSMGVSVIGAIDPWAGHA